MELKYLFLLLLLQPRHSIIITFPQPDEGRAQLNMTFTHFLSKPSVALLVTTIFIWLSYLACLAFYRLFLHPLAKFPGPKLAGLTKWYEFYYEVPLKGQFTFHIQDLHKKYGMNATSS
jgi:hypothetical protein